MPSAVTPELPEPEAWASSFGQRLRYLQANLADETPDSRQSYLEEELKRALQPVPSSRRAAARTPTSSGESPSRVRTGRRPRTSSRPPPRYRASYEPLVTAPELPPEP